MVFLLLDEVIKWKYSLDCEFEELKVTKILSSLALGSL